MRWVQKVDARRSGYPSRSTSRTETSVMAVRVVSTGCLTQPDGVFSYHVRRWSGVFAEEVWPASKSGSPSRSISPVARTHTFPHPESIVVFVQGAVASAGAV